MRDVYVLSRKKALKLRYIKPEGVKSAMVSISTVGKRYNATPRVAGDIRKILYLNFDDVEAECEDGFPMTEKDAEKTAAFLKNCLNGNTERLYIHCDADRSRSAAIAAALQDYAGLTKDQMHFMPDTKPNKHVYELVSKALRQS